MAPDLACGKMGSLVMSHPASSVAQRLKMPPTSPQPWDMDLPDPACVPDSFACIMLGIDWIDDIEIQVLSINFIAELKAFRAELIQP